MGEVCSMPGISEMCAKFWVENLKGRDHFEYVAIDGRIILEWILEK
jgi:hypothetical protein